MMTSALGFAPGKEATSAPASDPGAVSTDLARAALPGARRTTSAVPAPTGLCRTASGSSLGRGERLGSLRQHEVVCHLVERRRHGFAGRRLAGRPFDKVDDQRLFHGINNVGVEVLAVSLKEVGDKAMIARCGDREMNVRRP